MNNKKLSIEYAIPFSNNVKELLFNAKQIHDYLSESAEPLINIHDEHKGVGPNGDFTFTLRPTQMELCETFTQSDCVINSCRQYGNTTMLVAFSDWQKSQGKDVLVLGKNHTAIVAMRNMATLPISCKTFSNFADCSCKSDNDQYDYILIDDAAFIPYSLEEKFVNTIRGSLKPNGKTIVLSVPSQARGWFHELYTGNHGFTKYTVDWKDFQTPEWAIKMAGKIGQEQFDNTFCNVFRPIKD